jgi:hypothetical protein
VTVHHCAPLCNNVPTQCNNVKHSATLYNTVPRIIQHSTAQYSTLQHCTTQQHITALYNVQSNPPSNTLFLSFSALSLSLSLSLSLFSQVCTRTTPRRLFIGTERSRRDHPKTALVAKTQTTSTPKQGCQVCLNMFVPVECCQYTSNTVHFQYTSNTIPSTIHSTFPVPSTDNS